MNLNYMPNCKTRFSLLELLKNSINKNVKKVLKRIQNKEGVARVEILFEDRVEKAFVACQTLLVKYHAPQVKTFVNKVVSSGNIVLYKFTSEEFN